MLIGGVSFVIVLLVAIGLVAYLIVKRPADVSNPDAEFVVEGVQQKGIVGVADWPFYGLNEERTRYLPAEGLEPPFNVTWRFNGRKLLEYSPIVVEGSLYGVNNNGEAFAVKTRSGKVRWRTEIASLNASSPAYADGQLFIANLEPGRVQALNAKNGVRRWKRDLPGRTESSPVVVGKKVIVGCECGTLYAFDAATGKTLWEADLPGEIKAAPAVSDGVAYIGDYSGSMNAVNIANGDIEWQSSSQGTGLSAGRLLRDRGGRLRTRLRGVQGRARLQLREGERRPRLVAHDRRRGLRRRRRRRHAEDRAHRLLRRLRRQHVLRARCPIRRRAVVRGRRAAR